MLKLVLKLDQSTPLILIALFKLLTVAGYMGRSSNGLFLPHSLQLV